MYRMPSNGWGYLVIVVLYLNVYVSIRNYQYLLDTTEGSNVLTSAAEKYVQ